MSKVNNPRPLIFQSKKNISLIHRILFHYDIFSHETFDYKIHCLLFLIIHFLVSHLIMINNSVMTKKYKLIFSSNRQIAFKNIHCYNRVWLDVILGQNYTNIRPRRCAGKNAFTVAFIIMKARHPI